MSLVRKKCSICGSEFWEEETAVNNADICNHVDCFDAVGLNGDLR